jgi:hypothetical protein
MAALSETAQDFESSKALRQSLQQAGTVNRSGRVFLGSVLAISALGLWLVPVADGDTGMRLIKILVSLVLLGLGAMFISSIDEAEALPEIQIDTQNRELRIMQLDKSCKQTLVARHKLDDLTEVSLKDQVLTAKSKTGETVISLPVRDAQTENALRSVLQGVA